MRYINQWSLKHTEKSLLQPITSSHITTAGLKITVIQLNIIFTEKSELKSTLNKSLLSQNSCTASMSQRFNKVKKFSSAMYRAGPLFHPLKIAYTLQVILFLRLPHLPVYKSTLYSLKISPKNGPRLIHGSKTEIKKSSGQISIIIKNKLKENSETKDNIFKKILTQK